MKQLLVVLASVYAIAAQSAQSPMQVIVPAGATEFQVSLQANPSTGYQWSAKTYDKNLLKLVSSQYKKAGTNLIGASGVMTYTFELLKKDQLPASTVLNFNYARSWEQAPGRTQQVKVFFRNAT